MSEVVVELEDRVKNAIRLGESHFREFKGTVQRGPVKRSDHVTTICRHVAEALVAFANADGGELLVGVEDDGGITGVDLDEEYLDLILKAPTSHVHPDTPIDPQRARVNL